MDSETLTELAKDSSSGVIIRKQRVHLALYPALMSNTKSGVNAELKSRLYRYHRDFEGLLIRYENVKILNENNINVDEFGVLHITLIAKVYIFRPSKGVITTGIVSNLSGKHIGCNIFGKISATAYLKREERVPPDLVVGCKVKLMLNSVSHRGPVTKLAGSYLSWERGTSAVEDIDSLLDDTIPDMGQEDCDPSAINTSVIKVEKIEDDDETDSAHNKKKKKKKKKHKEDSDEVLETVKEENSGTTQVKEEKCGTPVKEEDSSQHIPELGDGSHSLNTSKSDKKAKKRKLIKEEPVELDESSVVEDAGGDLDNIQAKKKKKKKKHKADKSSLDHESKFNAEEVKIKTENEENLSP